jgi:hypothetical protein
LWAWPMRNERCKKFKVKKIGTKKEDYLKLLRLCVPHLLQEQEHNEYICENLK